jgi:hypothetical protein
MVAVRLFARLRPSRNTGARYLPYVEDNMATGMLSTLGLGLVIGTISRFSTREPELEQLRKSARIHGSSAQRSRFFFHAPFATEFIALRPLSSERGWPSLHRWLRKI